MKKNPKKKIIISCYDDLKNPVYSGGGAYSVARLAKKLAKKYKVTVLTGTYKNAKNEIIDGVKYLRIGSDILGHKIGQLIFQIALIKYAKKAEFNIWIEGSTPPFTFSLLPMLTKKPVISWIHMICSYDIQRKYFLKLHFIEKTLCKPYRYIIVPTTWVEKEIKNMNKQAVIKKIPYGYNQSFSPAHKKTSNKNKYLLFIGRIEINQKGLDLLLKSLSLSKDNTKVIIAGKGAAGEEKKLNDLINKYKLYNKVQLIGRVVNNEKEQLLNNASAVIIPSRYETFVTVAQESIIHQKPVICFDIPQNEWIEKKYSFKITPFDTRKLAEIMNKVCTKKTYKNITIRDKKTFINKFSWENFTAKFESFIAKIAL